MNDCRSRFAVTLALIAACLVPPATASLSAQNQPRTPARTQSGSALRCESTDGGYQRCPAAGTWRGARLVEQISTNPCIQGRTWGFERDAIWVNNGCRGVFDAGDAFAKPGERVTCAGSGRTECPADTRYGITLTRRLSDAACVQGQSWGYGDDLVWVDRGCRAEFQVNAAPAEDTTGGTMTETVTCGTSTGTQVSCRVNGRATAVRLVRDLSGGRCREGQTWGNTDAFIWTTRGCRAQFEVTAQAAAGGAQTGTAVISCGSTTGRQVVCDTEGEATRVTLQRDQSGGRCRQGQTWGNTDSFIWTNQGCRGEFTVAYRETSAGREVGRRITCGTTDPQRLACRPGGTVRSARVVRDLSSGRCRQDQSWGYAGDSLWVGNGCVAEFALAVQATGGELTRIIACGSRTGQQMSCEAQGRIADVRLVTDLSGGRCREGDSWGHTEAVVWANKGCRARFEVSYAGATPRN